VTCGSAKGLGEGSLSLRRGQPREVVGGGTILGGFAGGIGGGGSRRRVNGSGKRGGEGGSARKSCRVEGSFTGAAGAQKGKEPKRGL